ncbi:hypothetical protein NQ315_005563 [Exocentrus adspersus]|uniref:Ig-like domain-containing protein n=1 Tax=Exocentrus adspersus TaxID=1586481 RepID=A0AAV8VTE5_9CUCU|nr:hypothetical protein NQ315_005563 [Exocentrus adspersus]
MINSKGVTFHRVIFSESSSLRAMKIRVPEVARSGDTVTLSCEYDLEQVALYSIKWYWNDEEFYRFVPKESPPFRAFSMRHVNVDISRSGPTEVTLRGVRREQTGDYKCEVSADGPLFHTDIKGAHMIVADLPSSNPVMNIEPTKVEIGKKITAYCYSPGSNPAANLTWFINDEEVSGNNDSVTIHPTEISEDEALNLLSSKSKIEVTTNKSHFILGTMTIRCESSIYSIWRESVEKVVRDDTPQLAPVLGSTASQSHIDQVIEIISSGSDWITPSNHHVLKLYLELSLLTIFLR